jgi:hypothetical protein
MIGLRLAAMACAVLAFSGCAQIREFTLADAQAAKARALRNGDPAGERCWSYVEAQLIDGAAELDIAGIMDAVEAARIVRLKAPQRRKEISASCGEVFADVIVELAKRGAKRGF